MKIKLSIELDIPEDVYRDDVEDSHIKPENLESHHMRFVNDAVFDNIINFAYLQHLLAAMDAMKDKNILIEIEHKKWAKLIGDSSMKIEKIG